jgi:hypothetical protein
MPPTGVGATTVANDPTPQGLPFVADPGAFFAATEKNEWTALQFAAPGGGATERRQLPATGILANVRIMFIGDLNVTNGTAGTTTSTGLWPYSLIDQLVISANAQNDLYSASGNDLYALRAARHPGFMPNDTLDVVGAGIGAGNLMADTDLVLTWEVPIAIDPATIIGALYAQSPAMFLELRMRQAVIGDLFVIGGTAIDPVITGTFFVEVTSFDIPLAGDARSRRLVVPDLSRLHGFQSHNVPVTAVGETRAPLIRTNGQLDRLFFQVWEADPAADATDRYLSAEPNLDEIDAVRIEYGAGQRPLDYNPAGFLMAKNLEHYGDALPLDYYAIDMLAENPPRDVILMTGVTDLNLVVTINAGVVLAAGSAVRVVQETLMA